MTLNTTSINTPIPTSKPSVSNTPFTTSLGNSKTEFKFDSKHKLTEFDKEEFFVSKLAKVVTQSLNDQVNKTQDAVTKPSESLPSGPLGASNPNDKLIAGKILAEARSASKGIAPAVNNINIATGTINELSKLQDSSKIIQNASQTEKDGKVTDNLKTMIEGGQKVAQGVIDLVAPLLKGSPGVSLVGTDTLNIGANRGISINTRGAITNVSPQHNIHTSLITTTSEVSVEKVGLKSQESETRINATKNNVDRSTNNLQIHSSSENVSNNYTLYSKDLIQTVTANKLDSFVRGETQGNDIKYSVDNTMLYSIGDTLTIGVGESPPSKDKQPGFGIGSLLDGVSKNGSGGSLLTITPSNYSLQQKGKVSVQSSGLQTHIANKIANIAVEKVVNMSKQDVISVALGSEFRVGSSTGFSTFGGFGSTVIGNFNIIGNLMGFISGISEIAGLVFPDLELPSQLNIPNRSEKVSLEGKIKFDECLPKGLSKKDSPTNTTSTGSLLPTNQQSDTSNIQGTQGNDLPEYKDQEILDKLQEVYPEAGGLQLNKPKGKDKVEAITPETDTPLGIKSLPQTADPLQQPTTPHGSSPQERTNDSTQLNPKSGGAPNMEGTNTPNSTIPGTPTNDGSNSGSVPSSSSDKDVVLNKKPKSSTVVLDKKPKSNSQSGTAKSPSSNSMSNSIKARYAPHTYIDIYKEEDYFSDLKTGTSNREQGSSQDFKPPSIKDYIERSSQLSPEQKQNISNNLKVINEVVSSESSTAKLNTALKTKVKALSESEVDAIVKSYLEINSAIAVGFGFLGDITAIFKEASSLVTQIYEQVDKAASVFGLDIQGGPVSSVMDIVGKVKSASNASSISELLGSLGVDFDEFMPITTSILGMLDGSKNKEDVIGSLSNSVSQLISPLLKDSGINPLITDTLLGAVSDVITNGTVMNRDKSDILNRIVSTLSSSGIVPGKAFEIANGLGNVVDGIQNGSLLPSLMGSGINTLFATLNNSIDLGPLNKVLQNINSVYGTIESLMAIPSMLEAMNDYDIPLLSQITSILDCVDVYTRLKDIVGIVKDPLNYEPQHKDSSLNLPTDLSINKLKEELTQKVLGNDSQLSQAILSGGTLNDFLTQVKGNSGGLQNLMSRALRDDSFFLLPPGNKAYLNSGDQVNSGKFLLNNKGDLLLTDKDDICRMEDIKVISNKEVVALDLPALSKDKKGGVLKSLNQSMSNKYLPEYKDKEQLSKAFEKGDLEPLNIKDKETQSLYTVDIGIKNNPQLMNELTNKSSLIHLKDPISQEEFIWSELEPSTLPNYVSPEDINSNKPRKELGLNPYEERGTVQHTKGTCKASLKELFQMMDRIQGTSTASINIATNTSEITLLRSSINIQGDSLFTPNTTIPTNTITRIEMTNKGYTLLTWNK